MASCACELFTPGDGVLQVDDCDDEDASKWSRLCTDDDADGFCLGGSAACTSERSGAEIEQQESLGHDCDDADPNVQLRVFKDADGDAHTVSDDALCVPANAVPDGYSPSTLQDCNDEDSDVNPSRTEQWRDHFDSDCDGAKDPTYCLTDINSDSCGVLEAADLLIESTCRDLPDLRITNIVSCECCGTGAQRVALANVGSTAYAGTIEVKAFGDPQWQPAYSFSIRVSLAAGETGMRSILQ